MDANELNKALNQAFRNVLNGNPATEGIETPQSPPQSPQKPTNPLAPKDPTPPQNVAPNPPEQPQTPPKEEDPQEIVIDPSKLEKAKVRIKEGEVLKEVPIPALLQQAQKVRELEEKLRLLEAMKAVNPAKPPKEKEENNLPPFMEQDGDAALKKELQQLKSKLEEIEQERMMVKIQEFQQARKSQAEQALDSYVIFKQNPILKDIAKMTVEGFLEAHPDKEVTEIVEHVAQRLTEVARSREEALLERAEQRRSLGGGPAPGQKTTIQIPSELKKEDLRNDKVRQAIEQVLRRRT